MKSNSNNYSENNDEVNKEYSYIVQIIVILVSAIVLFFMIFVKDYKSPLYLSVISLGVAFLYFFIAGYSKVNLINTDQESKFHLKGIYLALLLLFVIVITVLLFWFSNIFKEPKTNDFMSILSLSLTISTPYITDLINSNIKIKK